MEDTIRKIKAEIREIMTRYKCTYQEALCCLGKEKAAMIPNKHYMITYHRKDKTATHQIAVVGHNKNDARFQAFFQIRDPFRDTYKIDKVEEI